MRVMLEHRLAENSRKEAATADCKRDYLKCIAAWKARRAKLRCYDEVDAQRAQKEKARRCREKASLARDVTTKTAGGPGSNKSSNLRQQSSAPQDSRKNFDSVRLYNGFSSPRPESLGSSPAVSIGGPTKLDGGLQPQRILKGAEQRSRAGILVTKNTSTSSSTRPANQNGASSAKNLTASGGKDFSPERDAHAQPRSWINCTPPSDALGHHSVSPEENRARAGRNDLHSKTAPAKNRARNSAGTLQSSAGSSFSSGTKRSAGSGSPSCDTQDLQASSPDLLHRLSLRHFILYGLVHNFLRRIREYPLVRLRSPSEVAEARKDKFYDTANEIVDLEEFIRYCDGTLHLERVALLVHRNVEVLRHLLTVVLPKDPRVRKISFIRR
ncbi:unnamed protein product [Amoebophrya sp. A25]|nr:unnamed protein product [Amoebophrya sp. A25]|eukprot:GSA25T00005051001.1